MKKPRRSQEQKLREAIMNASVALRDTAPLRGRGVNQSYLDVFSKYSDAIKALVQHVCGLHIEEWSWDGYEACFTFKWGFAAQLQQPHKAEYDTRYVHMATRAQFDDEAPLDAELARLQAEAEHYDELRATTMRWARDVAVASRKAP